MKRHFAEEQAHFTVNLTWRDHLPHSRVLDAASFAKEIAIVSSSGMAGGDSALMIETVRALMP